MLHRNPTTNQSNAFVRNALPTPVVPLVQQSKSLLAPSCSSVTASPPAVLIPQHMAPFKVGALHFYPEAYEGARLCDGSRWIHVKAGNILHATDKVGQERTVHLTIDTLHAIASRGTLCKIFNSTTHEGLVPEPGLYVSPMDVMLNNTNFTMTIKYGQIVVVVVGDTATEVVARSSNFVFNDKTVQEIARERLKELAWSMDVDSDKLKDLTIVYGKGHTTLSQRKKEVRLNLNPSVTIIADDG